MTEGLTFSPLASMSFSASRFPKAVAGDLPGAPGDGGVELGPVWPQVDDGGIVAEVSLPDRTAGVRPGEIQLPLPRGPAGVQSVHGGFLGPSA